MRTHQVVFTAEAEGDLDVIYEHITASSGEDRARSVVDRLVKSCLALDVFPRRGTPRDDLIPGLRIIAHRNWASIAFTIEGVLWRGRDAASVLDRNR